MPLDENPTTEQLNNIKNDRFQYSEKAHRVISAGDLVDQSTWSDIRFDSDDTLPDYIGLNLVSGAATSATDWVVYKFTYSGTATTRVQRAVGTWDGRAGLF